METIFDLAAQMIAVSAAITHYKYIFYGACCVVLHRDAARRAVPVSETFMAYGLLSATSLISPSAAPGILVVALAAVVQRYLLRKILFVEANIEAYNRDIVALHSVPANKIA